MVLQGYLLDVTARKEAEEQLRHQAFHDALTGLANRALFTNRVEHALVLRSQRHATEVAVLFLDLDDFKGVNDTLGPRRRRRAPARVSVCASATRVRPSDTVARLGGDEFAVLLEEVAGARHRPSTPRSASSRPSSEPFDIEGRRGLRHARASGSRSETVARRAAAARADVAMYRAKAAGKAQYVIYAPSDGRRASSSRLELVGGPAASVAPRRVRRCTTSPIVDLEERTPWSGSRRSLRWDASRRAACIAAGDFIPLAEETGKIVELGAWVLHEACAQVGALAR